MMKTKTEGFLVLQRERFCRVYDFQKTDRPPRWEAVAFWPDTIAEWQDGGKLPKEIQNSDDVRNYYKMEPWVGVSGGLGLTEMKMQGVIREWTTIKEDATSSVMESNLGEIKRVKTDNKTSMPQFIRFAIESPEDWERKIKPHYKPEYHSFEGLEEEKRYVQSLGNIPVGLYLVGLYAFWRNFLGEEKLAYAFYDFPAMLHDMAKTWLAMHASNIGKVLSKIPCDWTLFHEDMAYKGGPLIGPNLFEKFMAPYYKELIQCLHKAGQRRIAVDSDGNNGAVLGCFVRLGVNGLYPFEVAAGSDAVAFRKMHPDFVVMGALDKRVLLQSKKEIREEVMKKVPLLWEQGGFIPSIDHAVPPCPIENFEFFLECVRSIFE